MKRIVQILLAIVLVVSLCTIFASAEESDTVTLDLATLGGTQSFTAHGYEGVTGLMFGYGTVVDLGSYDLSQYGALKVTYATDMGYKAFKDGMTATAMFALKSNNTTIGYANVGPNTEGLIASADCVDASEVNPGGINWGKGERAAFIDLKGVDYNGEVYLSHFNSSGNEALVVKLELLPYKNVALNKTVCANLNGGTAAAPDYWSPAMLTDGLAQDTNDGNALGWAFSTPAAGGTACNADAFIDLGAVYKVDSINVVNMKWASNLTVPGAYEIFVSTDGENWTQVAECAAGAATAGGTDTYTFDPVEANYVRLHVSSHSGLWGDAASFYSGFGELEVFGNYVKDSKIEGVPAFVPTNYVFSRDEFFANETNIVNAGGNMAISAAPLTDKVGQEITIWGWVVSTRPVESFGYQLDDGEIIYDVNYKYPAEDGVIAVGNNWGIGAYGESTRYKIVFTYDAPHTVKAYAKINGQDILFWTVYPAAVNWTDEIKYNEPFDATAPWAGFTSGTLKYQIVFNSDVDFDAIMFPNSWAAPNTPIKVTLAKDGNMDGDPVFTADIVRPGDGIFIIDLGQTVPAGQYILKLKITDDTLAAENQYAYYTALATAKSLLDETYINQTSGKAALALISYDEGTGFIPREVITRINVDGATAGETAFNTADNSTTEIPAGTTSMSFNGWVASNFPIEKYGYKIDGGETVYDDSFKKVSVDEDYNAIMAVAANCFSFAANGTGYRCLIQNAIPLTDGDHSVEIIALINGEEVHVRTFNVKNPSTETEIISATGGGVAGIWLRPSSSESFKVMFKTNQAFTKFNIHCYWASNPPQFGDLKANIEVSLYKFDTNLAKTLAGTPVATAKYLENLGDNNVSTPFSAAGTGATLTNYDAANQGFSLVLDQAAEAGQYVVVITNDAGEGSYVVLPSTSNAAEITYGAEYIKYFYMSDTEPSAEAVRFTLTLVDEGAFVELDPEQPDETEPTTEPTTEPGTEPGTEPPQTGDAMIAMFVVIAVLAMGAAVVFARKRSH